MSKDSFHESPSETDVDSPWKIELDNIIAHMVSRRTRLSLAQVLNTQPHAEVRVLCEKHGLPQFDEQPTPLDCLAAILGAADNISCVHLIEEIGHTFGSMRENVQPHYRWDQRMADLDRCLLLDGYRFSQNGTFHYDLQQIEPVLEGAAAVEDDLSLALSASGLAEANDVKALLRNSANAFTQANPDYNACLADARAALQVLATAIAKARHGAPPYPFDETKWGQVLANLRVSGLVTADEEEGLAGVFKFDSPGAHYYVGITWQEAARLGRGFAVSMCYFLVKKHLG